MVIDVHPVQQNGNKSNKRSLVNHYTPGTTSPNNQITNNLLEKPGGKLISTGKNSSSSAIKAASDNSWEKAGDD